LAPLLACVGCGTFLSIKGAGVDDPPPGGIVVNQRAVYRVSVTTQADMNEIGASKPFVTIDPKRVVSVNWRRMPFASGELVVKLNKEQALEEVGLTAATGAVRAAEAATSATEAAAEFQKQQVATP
jgi:hypothetical protein